MSASNTNCMCCLEIQHVNFLLGLAWGNTLSLLTVCALTACVAYSKAVVPARKLWGNIRMLTLFLPCTGHICVARQQLPLAAAVGPCGHPPRRVLSHRVPGDCSSAVPGSALWLDTRWAEHQKLAHIATAKLHPMQFPLPYHRPC